jgi:hypothetical protein
MQPSTRESNAYKQNIYNKFVFLGIPEVHLLLLEDGLQLGKEGFIEEQSFCRSNVRATSLQIYDTRAN